MDGTYRVVWHSDRSFTDGLSEEVLRPLVSRAVTQESKPLAQRHASYPATPSTDVDQSSPTRSSSIPSSSHGEEQHDADKRKSSTATRKRKRSSMSQPETASTA